MPITSGIFRKTHNHKVPVYMRKVAQIISIVGHPFITIPAFILIALLGNEITTSKLLVALLLIGGLFVPISIIIYYKTKKGTYSNLDVSDRLQRKSLFLYAIPLLAAVTTILYLTGQPRQLCLALLFALILVIISQVVNLYIKSSLHVSLNIYLSFLIITQNITAGLIALLLTGIIGWSRIKLERHTPKEVFWGILVGSTVSLLLLRVEQ